MRQAGTEELGQDGKGKGEGEGGLPPCSDGPPQPHAVRYPLPFTPFPPDPSFPGPVPLFTYRLQVVAGSSHASQALLSALPTPTSPSTAPMLAPEATRGVGRRRKSDSEDSDAPLGVAGVGRVPYPRSQSRRVPAQQHTSAVSTTAHRPSLSLSRALAPLSALSYPLPFLPPSP